MVFASGLSRLALVRAPLGMGCRAPTLRLGPTGFHPARLRAPLAHRQEALGRHTSHTVDVKLERDVPSKPLAVTHP